jgi:hypothetical protein
MDSNGTSTRSLSIDPDLIQTLEITFWDVLKDINQESQQSNLVETQPGYWNLLLKFLEICQSTKKEWNQLMTKFLGYLRNLIEYWTNNIETLCNLSYEDLLKHFEKVLPSITQTLFNASTKSQLLIYVNGFENLHSDLTEEDCVLSASTIATYTLSTNALIPIKCADASLTKKRKSNQMLSLDDLLEEDEDQELPPLKKPTGKTYTFTSTRKEGRSRGLFYKDQWKKYKATIKIWKTEDIADIPYNQRWEHAHREMTLNYEENSAFHKILTKLEHEANTLLLQKRKEGEVTTSIYSFLNT